MQILQFQKVNCKNCYKCVRHCPVKAIAVRDHQAQILEEECVLCGRCTIVCPQNAKEDRSDLGKVKGMLQRKETVKVSLAPSYIAYFQTGQLRPVAQALQRLGFSQVGETAEGAYLVKTQYERLAAEHWQDNIISSCCPTVNRYLQKHCPEALPYLAPVLSPMEAHAKRLKEQDPGCKVVFIGPCISKKGEAAEPGRYTDAVLTFEEVAQWLEEAGLSLQACRPDEGYLSRLFPIRGGILRTMRQSPDYHYLAVDGLEDCMAAIEEIRQGRLKGCFLEMSACKGGCIGGPSFRKHPCGELASVLEVEQNSSPCRDYDLPRDMEITRHFSPSPAENALPTAAQLEDILKRMGKHSPAEELNCGMCGYASCKEKAVAVFQGKAEISMCLPFMKERAESFSNQILDVTPNAILSVGLDFKVQQMNHAACRMFGIGPEEAANQPVGRFLEEFDFVDMIANGREKLEKRAYLADWDRYVEQVFLYDKNKSRIVCIMKDITAERRKKQQIRATRQHAADMADDIVAKQQRIVQEIASLLGETAAETKIAVRDLKETILMDEEDG